jgi:hypothetical protein
MQQEAVQAMLVACISENDPSAHLQNPGTTNRLLTDGTVCADFLRNVAASVPKLLAPQATATPNPPTTPKADKAISDLQTEINSNPACHTKVAVDGIAGPKTAAAAAACIKPTG